MVTQCRHNCSIWESLFSPPPPPTPLHTPPPPPPPTHIPKGGWGCLMSLPCVESKGCHWVPLSYLLSCFSARPCLSFCLALFQVMVQSPDVFQNILHHLSLTLSIKKQTCSCDSCWAGLRWWLAAMWHWPLYIHVYDYILDIISFLCCCYCSLKKNKKTSTTSQIAINHTEWLIIPTCPTLMGS